MRLKNDDPLHAVNSVFLGPRRITLPWTARYVSYGIGAGILLVILVLQRRGGIAMSVFSFSWALGLTVGLTTAVGKRIDFERPFRTMVVAFVHEVTAPRPPARQSCTIRVPKDLTR